MEKIKDIIGKYIPFVWWVYMAVLSLCACVCCAAQAACGFGTFWAVCGAVGTGTAAFIFAWQAWGEWQEKDSYGDD